MTQEELEIADTPVENGVSGENGEAAAATPEAPAKRNQVIMIDGEALSYENSIVWECFPGNLEILVSDSLFTANKTFSYRLTAEIERDRIYKQAVDSIWGQFDKDNSGALDKAETKKFLQRVLENIPPPNHFDESKFDDTFHAMDKNGNGLVEKNEMVMFIKSIMRQREQAGQ